MSYADNKSPAMKARATRERNLAAAARIGLKTAKTVDDVDAILREIPMRFRGDVFWTLDNDYHGTPNHGLLRTFRNSRGMLDRLLMTPRELAQHQLDRGIEPTPDTPTNSTVENAG